MPADPVLPRYVMSYFTDDLEALFLATSADGTRFTSISGDEPVLRSGVGSRTMRDPYVGRGPDGRFHLVATDGWASPSLVHSVSDDLLAWSEPRLVPVMAPHPDTLNVWAPEFFPLAGGGARLIWSSTVTPDPVRDAEGRVVWGSNDGAQKIWACDTADFVTFGEPFVYFSPGYTVIDASAHLDDEFAILSFKDERGVNREGTDHKDIQLIDLDAAGHPTGPSRPAGTPHLVEGPNIFRVDSELRLIYDVFLTPHYAGRASTDGIHWHDVDLDLPAGTKHASVLALTASEGTALAAALSSR